MSNVFTKVVISARLRCRSALHIGDGDIRVFDANGVDQSRLKAPAIAPVPPQSTSALPKLVEPRSYNSVVTVADGAFTPYIPGSTLRGSLRRLCNRFVDELFGPEDIQGGDDARAGLVEVRAATWQSCTEVVEKNTPYWSPSRKTGLTWGIRIDPVTRTVAEGSLFVHEFVPAETTFDVALTAHRISPQQLQELVDAMGRWQGDLVSAMGHYRTKGWGRVELDVTTLDVRVGTRDEARAWIQSPTVEPWDLGDPYSITPSCTKTRHLRAVVRLELRSPLLVNDPGYVLAQPPKSSRPDDEIKIARYSLVTARTVENEPMIPAKTLKGWLRGQARFIVSTIAHRHFGATADDASRVGESLAQAIFGSSEHVSRLRVSQAELDHDVPAVDAANGQCFHSQTFTAIDRFTGGVMDTALFQVQATASPAFSFELYLDDQLMLNQWTWARGLALLLIRDLMEDDIPIGWGKGRGYGWVRATVQISDSFCGFDEIVRHFEGSGDRTSRQCIEELHQKIRNTLTVPDHEDEAVIVTDRAIVV